MNADKEALLSGDVATYWESVKPHTTFIHVGVVEMRPSESRFAKSRIPWVLSKWDSTSGEVLHHCRDVPFDGMLPGLRERVLDGTPPANNGCTA